MENKELYMKFPCVLRKALEKGKISFDLKTTQFDYEPFCAYRIVFRKDKSDFSPIDKNDFKSNVELDKPCDLNDIGSYSNSFYLQDSNLKNTFKLPQHPERKIIKGKIYCEGGPERTDNKTGHVDWWLYEDADISSFKYVQMENMV